MLCFDRILLMQLKVGPTEDMKASNFGFSLRVSSVRWIDSTVDLVVIVAVQFECTMEEFQFS